MFRIVLICMCVLSLIGCNHIYVKPNTLDPNSVIYADRGGYTMRKSIKESLEQRGHTIVVGYATANTSGDSSDSATDINLDTYAVPKDAKYVVKVYERKDKYAPAWCIFNGFWWWNFNVSIADQTTGEELMAWSGRGCANSSLRLLDKVLDELEKKDEQN